MAEAKEGGGWLGMLGALYSAVNAVLSATLKPLAGMYDLFRKPAVQGSAEVASALFTGQAYVPYGDGQRAPSLEDTMQPTKAAPAQEQAVEQRKGMKM